MQHSSAVPSCSTCEKISLLSTLLLTYGDQYLACEQSVCIWPFQSRNFSEYVLLMLLLCQSRGGEFDNFWMKGSRVEIEA